MFYHEVQKAELWCCLHHNQNRVLLCLHQCQNQTSALKSCQHPDKHSPAKLCVFSSSCLLLIMISALGHAVCRPHNKKGPRACRAVYSFSKVSSVWEEPWSATLFFFIIYVFTKTKFVLCAVFLIWNRLTVCTGVLHGAVVLITELCERNPDTLDQFRKVIFSRSYTLTVHRCTDHLWYFPSHYIRLFLNWFRSWKVLWHPAILQSTT